jgi:hypothetical protein
MKVMVNIEGLKLKIYEAQKEANNELNDHTKKEYHSGKASAYLDILCGYLGIKAGTSEKWDLDQRIWDQYHQETDASDDK